MIVRRASKCRSDLDRQVLVEACKILTGEDHDAVEEGEVTKDDQETRDAENQTALECNSQV